VGGQPNLKHHHFDICFANLVTKGIGIRAVFPCSFCEGVFLSQRGSKAGSDWNSGQEKKISGGAFAAEVLGWVGQLIQLLAFGPPKVFAVCFDFYQGHFLLGSLAGAAQSLKNNEIDQSWAHARQKLAVEIKVKSSIEFEFQCDSNTRKRGLTILNEREGEAIPLCSSRPLRIQVTEKLPQG